MTCEVKLTGPSMEQRIANRLKNSGDAKHADVVVQKGDSPERAITNIHHSRNQQYGDGERGVDINGRRRDVV